MYAVINMEGKMPGAESWIPNKEGTMCHTCNYIFLCTSDLLFLRLLTCIFFNGFCFGNLDLKEIKSLIHMSCNQE